MLEKSTSVKQRIIKITRYFKSPFKKINAYTNYTCLKVHNTIKVNK